MACHCSSPLFICHVEVGCICPPGKDCQERLDTREHLDLETETEILNRLWHHLELVVGLPVSVLLLIAFSLVCCSVGYYNSKLKKMKRLIATNTNNTSSLPEPKGQLDDSNVEVDSNHDRKSITSLSQVLSLYEARLNSASSSVSSEERSLQLNVGSVSSQDTTISMEEEENCDYLDYDHLDHNRFVNDISPNYCHH